MECVPAYFLELQNKRYTFLGWIQDRVSIIQLTRCENVLPFSTALAYNICADSFIDIYIEVEVQTLESDLRASISYGPKLNITTLFWNKQAQQSH